MSNFNYYSKFRSGTLSKSGQTDFMPTAAKAEAEARRLGENAALGISSWGGSGVLEDKKIGIGKSPRTVSVPSAVPYQQGYIGYYTATQSFYQYQTFFIFSKPEDYNNISSANLIFTSTNNTYLSADSYYISIPVNGTFTPPDEDDSVYINPLNDELDQNNRISFQGNGVAGATYSIDITDLIKICCERDNCWFLISRNSTAFSGSNCVISEAHIEYEYNFTRCEPPTSLYFSSLTEKSIIGSPTNSNSITLNWSGAQAGLNNPIVGYRLYYKFDAQPIIGGSDGFFEINSNTNNKTINLTNFNNVDLTQRRGQIIYFKVSTKGEQLVNNGYYSSLSDDYVQIKINSLPGQPTNLTVDKTRVKSTGDNVIFSITPGNDIDSSQNVSIYYSINNSTTKNSFSNSSILVNATTTYHFWSYDGLEYSANSTDQIITLSTAPTINSVTLAPNSGSSSEGADVLNIQGNASVNSGSATVINYKWSFITSDTSSFSSIYETSIFKTDSLFANYDVSQNSELEFGKYYKLKLIIEDDYTKESATAQSSIYYHINDISSSSIVLYNTNAAANKTGTNTLEFEDYIRVNFNTTYSFLTKRELICTINNTSYIKTLANSNVNDVNVKQEWNISRGQSCIFSVRVYCNNLNKIISFGSYTRAKDAKPTNVVVTKSNQNYSYIHPYTDQLFTCVFNQNNILSWSNSFNFTGENNYNFYFVNKSNQEQIQLTKVANSGSNTQGLISFQLSLNIDTTTWKTFFDSNYAAPEGQIALNLLIVPENNFGHSNDFKISTSVTLDFTEQPIVSNITANLKIKTGENSYTSLNSNYSSSSRYTVFPTQILQFSITGIKVYNNQNINFVLKKDNNILKTSNLTLSSSNIASLSGNIYTLNELTFDYELPESLFNIVNSSNLDFNILVNTNSTNTTINHNNFKICKIYRIVLSEINPTIIDYNETSKVLRYNCNYTGDTSICSAIGNITYSTNRDSDYSNFCSNISSLVLSSESTANLSNTENLTADLYYFKMNVILTFNYISISGNEPVGTKQYNLPTTPAIYIYYRDTPNLLYGKNFFVINGSSPKMNGGNEVDDQLLVIRPTATRTKIYFGNDESIGVFELTSNGVIIDGGSWS